MLADFLISLVAVGIAELGDKTQLCILFTSSKTKNHTKLLMGITLGYLIVDGAAILAGSFLSALIPQFYVKIVAGGMFIAFGVMTFLERGICQPDKMRSQNPFLAGFLMIFMTEWGDKTQLSSGLLAMQYNPLAVLAGTLVAIFALSAMAIYAGKFITKKINPKTMTKIAGAAFILIGLSFLIL
jgi:putative Ca2+/H+ antiporter (TMEM165/GDT1 family)